MQAIWQYIQHNQKWIVFLLVIAGINAVINVGVIVSEQLAHHQEVEWTFHIINEFTGSYILLLFIPPLVWVFRKWPLESPHLLSRLGLYLTVSVIFGVCYTSLMYLSRVPLYHLAGITRLEEIFNDLPYRYLMEYFKQFFTFWLIYIVYWAFTQYQANRNREVREARLKEELLRSQVQSLQMQLHPHFFFNTLNTISSLMYKDPGRADRLISRLSVLLRNVLGLKDRPVHSLKEEIGLLEQFTDVMLERYPDKLSVRYQIPNDCREKTVPVLLLQPIVENAIRYAVDFRSKTVVEIRARQSNGRLDIEIADNGPGIREGAPATGTGLSATLLRLEKLYGEQYRFELQNRETGGLSVQLSIPQDKL